MESTNENYLKLGCLAFFACQGSTSLHSSYLAFTVLMSNPKKEELCHEPELRDDLDRGWLPCQITPALGSCRSTQEIRRPY